MADHISPAQKPEPSLHFTQSPPHYNGHRGYTNWLLISQILSPSILLAQSTPVTGACLLSIQHIVHASTLEPYNGGLLCLEHHSP